MYNPNAFTDVPATLRYDGLVYNFALMNPLSVLTVTNFLFFHAAASLKQFVT